MRIATSGIKEEGWQKSRRRNGGKSQAVGEREKMLKYSQQKEGSHSTTAYANYAGRVGAPVGPARLCVYADDITAFHSLPPPVSLTHTHKPSLEHKHTFKLERGRELMRKLMGEDKNKLVKRDRGKEREKKEMEGWKITNPQDSCSALPRQSGICQTTAKNKTTKTTCLDFLFH